MSVPIGTRAVDDIGVLLEPEDLYASRPATSSGFDSIVGEYMGGI